MDIYAIPHSLRTVKIDPAAEVTTLGAEVLSASGTHKWYGGLLGGRGCIYGVPPCASPVLKINPAVRR